MAENTLFKKLRKAFFFREDNHARLGLFLRRGHLPARLANFAFNAACKAARDVRRVTRRQERAPARTGVCAFIAELSIPQCRHYRVSERAAQLRHLGWTVRLCPWETLEAAMQALQLASFVLFYRTPMVGHMPALYAEARRLGIPILYDIDDLIFDREGLAAYMTRLNLSAERAAAMLEKADSYRRAMEEADMLLASTPALARHAAAVGRPCFVAHNSVADDLAHLARTLPAKKADGEVVRIFYGSGSDTHDADFALIADALAEAMAKDTRLHLHIHGHLELPETLSAFCGRIHRAPFLDGNLYYRVIADYDIALMPLARDTFNEAKSNIKYQEASLFGIPSIASPTAEFLDAITDGVDGFLASGAEDWRDRILLLASDPGLRTDMAKRAQQNVLKRYANTVIADTELRPVLPQMAPVDGRRLLLVSTSFGKGCTDGGAMVVTDTAQALEHQGFEVFVFSLARTDAAPHGAVVRHDWRGIKIMAANLRPGGLNQENPETDQLFRQVLEAVQPDLVHFHSIEGLGPGLPQECIRSGIAYVITMHDAWWVCPRRFMLDPAGNYCAQSVVDPETCRSRCGLDEAAVWRRRTRMLEAVAVAGAVFTPSDFYNAFVRRNFPRNSAVLTNRNGIRPPEAPRTARAAGPLRLGYLGGKARWKGYYFLAEALRGLGRDDFELLLVDLDPLSGTSGMADPDDHALWRGLPVRILPFTEHAAADGLYAQMDVLLFPSLGDESFGLPVREAMARDIFVLSSDCGGPREALVDGENGLLFPKGDAESFRMQLRRILDDQARFKNYRTANDGDVRGIMSQSAELAVAYGKITRS